MGGSYLGSTLSHTINKVSPGNKRPPYTREPIAPSRLRRRRI